MRKQGLTEAERYERAYGELQLLAGNTLGLMRTDRADLKIIRIRPGEATSYHKHLVAESIFHVLIGEILVRTGEEQVTKVSKGETFLIGPHKPHQLVNSGDAIAEVLEVESPPHDSSDKYLIAGLPSEARVGRPIGRFWMASPGTRIKICGVSSLDAAYNCMALGVDAVGLHACGAGGISRMREWSRWLSAIPHELSVFLLTDAKDLVELINLARWSYCDTIQLQGFQSIDEIRRIGDVLHERGWKLVKSIGVKDVSPELASTYAREVLSHVDAILLDSAFRGGTGQPNEWGACACAELARAIGRPVILAGGLRASNIAEALARVQPFAIDVESGVEVRLTGADDFRPSVRSYDLISKLVMTVQRNEQ